MAEDEELLTIDAKCNTLSIVLRDAGVMRLPKRNREEQPFGSIWNQDGPIARQRTYRFDADE